MTIRTPRRCSAPPNTGRNFRSKVSPNSTRHDNGPGPSSIGTNEHRHSGIGYVTPAQRHAGQDRALLSARHELYLQARRSNPRRWSGKTRDWTPITAVTLNPEQDTVIEPAASRNPLSSSTEAPAFPSRPDNARSTARNRASMARMASTGPSPKGAPWHTQCLSVDQVINASPATGKTRDKRILLRNPNGNLLDTHRGHEGELYKFCILKQTPGDQGIA
jgi:hypothetical protein